MAPRERPRVSPVSYLDAHPHRHRRIAHAGETFQRLRLQPGLLLDLALELQAGRERPYPNAPRTLDLDILLFGDQLIDLPRLQVPHYHMQERPFVLYPLAEITQDLQLPDGRSLYQLLQNCPFQGLQRLEGDTSSGNAVTTR